MTANVFYSSSEALNGHYRVDVVFYADKKWLGRATSPDSELNWHFNGRIYADLENVVALVGAQA